MTQSCIGFVQFWDRSRGFGFITPLGSNQPVYVQRDDIEGECQNLSDDQQVSFVLELGPGRFEAKHVRP
ncbi:cold shock domain-containing protein [Streptomyces beijiangensis]|uniref:Cold shock domain-containing protein n=2 Tax=Streptomyces beijiangensis TaxID=163361 RepID=A0A939F1Z2_9ACTN|nr:cold shock domain-containing protein [Streptomyces beijiangensis]